MRGGRREFETRDWGIKEKGLKGLDRSCVTLVR